MKCDNCKKPIPEPAAREVWAYGERLACFCTFFCIVQWIKCEGWNEAAKQVAYSRDTVIR